MHCETCAYNLDDPTPATCRRCGRYASNKALHLVFVLGAGAAAGVASNYLLTASVFGGSDLVWLKQALTVPGSIYTDPGYLAATLISLASLLVISALAGFHYGALRGLLVAVPMGIFSGVHLGWIAFPLVSTAAALPRLRGVHPAVWPTAATLLGGLYYLWLASVNGPNARSALVYRQGLFAFIDAVLVAAVFAAALAAVVSGRLRFRASYLPVAAVAPAALLWVLISVGAPPARMEANIITTLYAPRRSMRGPLGEGFITGVAPGGGEGGSQELAPGKQLGHVFDVLSFVDARRAAAVTACRRYLERFGDAPAAPEVMLLEADMHNARVDMRALEVFNRLECYFDMITPRAAEVYDVLIERFPDTPQAALARFRRAEGLLQEGTITQARAGFVEAVEALERHLPEGYEPVDEAPPRSVAELFRMEERERTHLLNELHDAAASARRRIRLVDENRDYADRPLARFAALDARGKNFERKASQILLDYPDSLITDNVRLALALSVRDPLQRGGELQALIDTTPHSDVRDRMLLELARAHLAGDLSGDGAARAELALRRLLADYPESTWAHHARALLSRVTRSP